MYICFYFMLGRARMSLLGPWHSYYSTYDYNYLSPLPDAGMLSVELGMLAEFTRPRYMGHNLIDREREDHQIQIKTKHACKLNKILENVPSSHIFDILRPEQNGRRFADDIFQTHFCTETWCVLIKSQFLFLRFHLTEGQHLSRHWLGAEEEASHSQTKGDEWRSMMLNCHRGMTDTVVRPQ